MTSRLAVAASLAFALAACGSSNQPSDQPSATVAAPTEAASVAPEAVSSAAAPSDTPSAAPTPTAKPSAKASPSAMQAASAPATPPQAFNQCAACHSTQPGKTIIGPSLAGVYGSKAGQVPGFQFSDAMKNSGLVWNDANLDKFLADPKSLVPGTLMGFAGLKDADKREAVIDYLKTLK